MPPANDPFRKQNLIRAARAMDANGVPRRQIADKLQISRNYLYRIMRGKWPLKQVHQAKRRRASKEALLVRESKGPGAVHAGTGTFDTLSETEKRTISRTIGALASGALRHGRHDQGCAVIVWTHGTRQPDCDCGYGAVAELARAVGSYRDANDHGRDVPELPGGDSAGPDNRRPSTEDRNAVRADG